MTVNTTQAIEFIQGVRDSPQLRALWIGLFGVPPCGTRDAGHSDAMSLAEIAEALRVRAPKPTTSLRFGPPGEPVCVACGSHINDTDPTAMLLAHSRCLPVDER